MAIILRNNSLDTFSYVSGLVTVAPESSTNVDTAYWFRLLSDLTFMTDLRQNSVTISDGVTEYSYPESEACIRDILRDLNNAGHDTDGALIVRNKAAQRGWTFCSLPFEFETARLSDTLFSQDSSGNTRTYITLKAYDINNIEVTEAGEDNVNLETIVKTVIDFEPPHDYEVVGGELRTLTSIESNMRLWLIAAPDIPAPTGSKEMGGGINLRYLSPGNIWSVDGRVTKYATYHPVYHTNKIRFVFKYDAGAHESIQVLMQIYKL